MCHVKIQCLFFCPYSPFRVWFGSHFFSFFWGNKILLRSMGNPSTKPEVLPWTTWFLNMAHRSMIWWFIGGTAGHPYLKSNHQRVQVWIQHQKFTNRSFYIKNLMKKTSHMKSLVWDSCLFVLLGNQILLRSMGTLVPNQRFYHEQHDFLTWHTVPWFGDSSVEHGWTVGHPCLKSNHQRVQVWIQHQKFTNRSFYIKSLIKKKSHMKSLVWDSCLFVLFGK